MALSSLAAALTSLALNLSPNPFASYEIIFWLLGSLKDRSMLHVAIALPLIAIGCALLGTTGRALDAFSLGEEGAESLGIDRKRTRLLVIAGTALCVGAGTAVAGAISFVGLVVPHAARRLAGLRHAHQVAAAALVGAIYATAADVVARFVIYPMEAPVGAVTAVIGGLVLVVLLKRRAA